MSQRWIAAWSCAALVAAVALTGCCATGTQGRPVSMRAGERQQELTELVAVRRTDRCFRPACAVRRLQEAGLRARYSEPGFPHHATGTKPRAGTMVPRHSLVRLTVGDG